VNLNVSQAQSLSRISMPLLHTDNSPSLGIRITEALQLWDLDLGNDTQINSLSVLDSYGSLVFHNPTIYNLDFTFADIVFPQLTSVWNLTVTGGESEGLVAELDKLKTIYGSLVTQFLRVRFPELSHVATIGQAVSFISNAKVAMDFDDLISIGGDISVVNNANCSLNMNQLSSHWGDFSVVNNTNFSLNMNQLSSVGSFSMTGNVETTLPFLSSLERAENIHLQGYIDP
jgi:hypothetical protein